jgi:ferrous iron transport protein A
MLKGWRRGNGRCVGCCMRTSEASTLPLSSAQPGERLKVKSITGGRQLCARMASMGIYPGVEMELLCSGCGAPCLVRVNGGTLSLGCGVSDKILVIANSGSTA